MSSPTDVAESFCPSCSTPKMAQHEPSNAKNDRVYYRRGGRHPQTSLPVGGLSEADGASFGVGDASHIEFAVAERAEPQSF
jgi:hypothetical protein